MQKAGFSHDAAQIVPLVMVHLSIIQPSTSMTALELSEDDDETETSLQEEQSSARTAGYSGHRKWYENG